jgi:hypothetical protein
MFSSLSAVLATGAVLREERISLYCRQHAFNPQIKVLERTFASASVRCWSVAPWFDISTA